MKAVGILGNNPVGGEATVGNTCEVLLAALELYGFCNLLKEIRQFVFRAAVKARAFKSHWADHHPSSLFRLGLPVQLPPGQHQLFGLIARGSPSSTEYRVLASKRSGRISGYSRTR